MSVRARNEMPKARIIRPAGIVSVAGCLQCATVLKFLGPSQGQIELDAG